MTRSPPRSSRIVEHRAPKTFVRSGPALPAARALGGRSAPYTRHGCHVARSGVPAWRSVLDSRKARAGPGFSRLRDQSGRRAILYHGCADPRARHGGVARLDADDEGDAIVDEVWQGGDVAGLTMGCGRTP